MRLTFDDHKKYQKTHRYLHHTKFSYRLEIRPPIYSLCTQIVIHFIRAQ